MRIIREADSGVASIAAPSLKSPGIMIMVEFELVFTYMIPAACAIAVIRAWRTITL
jgi:hypothetical protein